MDKLLGKYNLPKLNEDGESLNSPKTAGKIDAVIKNSWHRKALDQKVSQENFTNHLNKS